MKKEEERTLFKKKVGEDKSYSQIYQELDDLKKSQIIFKNQDKEIRNLRRQIEGLEKHNKVLLNKNFKINLTINSLKEKIQEQKRKEKKENVNPSKDKLIIRKVIKSLSLSGKPMTITDLKIDGQTSMDKMYGILGFLEENYIIRTFKDNKGVRYLL